MEFSQIFQSLLQKENPWDKILHGRKKSGEGEAIETVLEVKRLKKYFPIRKGFLVKRIVGWVKAVDDISFSVEKRKTFAIVGESGCGKTTTAKTVLRLHQPTGGKIIVNGEDTTFLFMSKSEVRKYILENYVSKFESAMKNGGIESIPEDERRLFERFQELGRDRFISEMMREIEKNLGDVKKKRLAFRRNMQIVFQDPMSSLNPRMTVGEIITEPILFHGIAKDKKEAYDMAAELLKRVGLKTYHLDRYPHQFSGGQRQRIAIARAISINPQIIILDEPTSALDVSVQAQIINLFLELQEKYGFTYLFISHDLGLVRFISDQVAVMYLGRIVEMGDTEEIFDNPIHPYTKALLSAVPVPDPAVERKRERIILKGGVPSPINRPSGCFFHPRCPWKMEGKCEKEYPPMVKVKENHYVACYLAEKL